MNMSKVKSVVDLKEEKNVLAWPSWPQKDKNKKKDMTHIYKRVVVEIYIPTTKSLGG